MDTLWYELTEAGQQAKKRIVIFKCLYMILSIVAFLIGFFQHIFWLAIVGGCLIVLYDILDMLAGLLNPAFPIVFAVILAVIIKPWYIGIFWASAIWHIISLPWYMRDLFGNITKDNKKYKPDIESYKKHIKNSNQRELERIKRLKENE